MKAFLLYPAIDFELIEPFAASADLVQDLDIDTLFRIMAAEDPFLKNVAQSAVLTSLQDSDTILYRQGILKDCITRPATIRQMYALAVEAIERERKVWHSNLPNYPQGTVYRSTDLLKMFIDVLRRMRHIADDHAGHVASGGLRRLFDMLSAELSDEYLHTLEEYLEGLAFRAGIQMGVKLGEGNKGTDYILLRKDLPKHHWYERLRLWLKGSSAGNREKLKYQVHERDEAGLQMLGEIKNYGIANVAAAVGQSTDHILSFFEMLRVELGFYIGCLNLHDHLSKRGASVCFPEPVNAGESVLTFCGLYDVCLQIRSQTLVVRNDAAVRLKDLTMITGANRGGKSTFLRSIGLAQLMLQSGMFVAAQSFRANICGRLFTHFKRNEDVHMKSGKLDEELKRMSDIVGQLQPGDMVLFNESFSSTNEREGSEIAKGIVSALLEMGIKVVYVTHMFNLAEDLYKSQNPTAVFLRAERLANGERTFRLIQGEPLPTSFGADLYKTIFA